jgi:hypothetical protein
VARSSIMYDMSETATYIPGRHKPFDLSNIFVDELPPKIEKPKKSPAVNLLGGQLRSFADYVRTCGRSEWALYPFRYKTAGGAAAGCNNARKTQGSGLLWECRGTSLFAKAVTR